MPEARAGCALCGAELAVDAASPFVGAPVIGALCPGCAAGLFTHYGGSIFALRHELPGARFALGTVTVTPGAVAALAEAGEHAAAFLTRHVQGDWGAFGHCDAITLSDDELRRGWEATDDTGKVNCWNLLQRRDMVMSEYAGESASGSSPASIAGRGRPCCCLRNIDRPRGGMRGLRHQPGDQLAAPWGCCTRASLIQGKNPALGRARLASQRTRHGEADFTPVPPDGAGALQRLGTQRHPRSRP